MVFLFIIGVKIANQTTDQIMVKPVITNKTIDHASIFSGLVTIIEYKNKAESKQNDTNENIVENLTGFNISL